MSTVQFLNTQYELCEDTLVWEREKSLPFVYSDGDSETVLKQRLEQAKDLACGSEELMAHMVDWPSRYHLSPQRADLLRPIDHLLTKKSVLEIGSGCGAITRYLGEIATDVVGIEGAARRAIIGRKRCRNQANVQIVCDNAMQFSAEKRFDAVTLIGVLEYSRKYVQAKDPVDALLKHCRAQLKGTGSLIVAIENQLGMKYMAGAPEDHLNQAFAGLNDAYSDDSVVTFGKKELTERLCAAGFTDVTFYYPFPDYKMPSVIFTEAGALNPYDIISNMTSRMSAGIQASAYPRTLSDEMLAGVIARNGLTGDLANSFLVVARTAEHHTPSVGTLGPHQALAYVYSTMRGRRFAKQTVLSDGPQGLLVHRTRLYPHTVPQDHSLKQLLCEQPAIAGKIYATKLTALVNVTGWTVESLVDWAAPWVAYLESQSIPSDVAELPNLPGTLLDCCPLNMIQTAEGDFEVFDLEWYIDSPIPLVYVLMRGIIHCLMQLKSVAMPASQTPTRLIELTAQIMQKLGYDLSEAEQRSVMRLEALFFRASEDFAWKLHLHTRMSPMDQFNHIQRLQAAYTDGAQPGAIPSDPGNLTPACPLGGRSQTRGQKFPTALA